MTTAVEQGAVYLRKERREGGPKTWVCDYTTGHLSIERAPFESLIDAINRAVAPAGLNVATAPSPGLAMTGPTLPETVLEASADERLFLVHTPVSVPGLQVSVAQWRESRVDLSTFELTLPGGDEASELRGGDGDVPCAPLQPMPGGWL